MYLICEQDHDHNDFRSIFGILPLSITSSFSPLKRLLRAETESQTAVSFISLVYLM